MVFRPHSLCTFGIQIEVRILAPEQQRNRGFFDKHKG